MGQAKRKRELSEAQRLAEEQRRKEERALFNTPRGRTGYRPKKVTLKRTIDGEEALIDFLVFADGTAYLPGNPMRKVTQPKILEAIRAATEPKPTEPRG